MVGGVLAAAASVLALLIGADSRFTMVAGVAILPGIEAAVVDRHHQQLTDRDQEGDHDEDAAAGRV